MYPVKRIAVFGLIGFFAFLNNSYSDDQVYKEKKKLSSYQRAIKEKEQALKRTNVQERKTISTLNQIEQKLAIGGRKLAVLKKSLRETQTGVVKAEKNLALAFQDLRRRENVLMRRLQGIHKYRSYKGINVLFDSADFADLTKRLYFMCLIAQADTKLIKRIRYQKEAISHKKGILQEECGKLAKIKQSEQSLLDEQAREAGNHRSLLTEIRNEKSLYLSQLKKLRNDSSQLARLIQQLEAKKRVRYPTGGDISYKAQGTLPWPLNGGTVIRGFGKYKHPKFKVDIVSKGIDILAPKGQIVSSVKAGEVVFANWFKGYGMLVMIDHGQGFYSLYAHLSDILVSEGGRVSTGTPIGKVGNTGTTENFNLHFEIRLNGRPVDPLNWLMRR